MRDRYHARNPRSWWMRCHAQTAGVSLTAQQPENNVARVALQALAAVLGGAQSLHTNSLDEAWALPTEQAVRTALRTQQIIAHESGVANTVDPLGGSWFIERLTDQMEEEARDYFRRIDDLGGVLPCIDNGFFVQEIARASYRYQREVEGPPARHRRRQRLRHPGGAADTAPPRRPRRASSGRSTASHSCGGLAPHGTFRKPSETCAPPRAAPGT